MTGRPGCLKCVVAVMLFSSGFAQYKPTWESLDTRPCPAWYDEVKIGVLMHWGVYSVPAFGNEWFWEFWESGQKEYVDFMAKNYRPGFTYADFAPQFSAALFDPNKWADIIAASGAGYYAITTKHHEGFCNWPTKVSYQWNSMEVGPHRDLVGELAAAIRNRTSVKFGIYHSLYEWYNDLYLTDKANGFKTQKFVSGKTMPELYELVNNYKPEFIWSDGEWEASDTYWNSTNFLAWLFNESPVKDTIVVNDRWGIGCRCKHGDYYTCDDRYNPGVLQKFKWENAMTIDRYSWGLRRESQLKDYLSIEELIAQLTGTVSCGGNLLVNVGPTADGRILPVFEERLRQMGSWLKVNGEAIYKSKPWTHQNDTLTKGIWYTMTKDAQGDTNVYAMSLRWPVGKLILKDPTPTSNTRVTLLGSNINIAYTSAGGLMTLHIPDIPVSELPCQWAWTFKMTNVDN